MAIKPGLALAQRFPEPSVVDEAEAPGQHDAQDRGEDERDAQRDVEPPGDDRAEGDDLAVREVGEPGRPVDQREPDGSKRDDQAEPQPLDGELGRLVPLAGEVALPLAEREEDRSGRAGHDDVLDRVLGGRGHALGKRLLVELDGVGAGPGYLDHPSPTSSLVPVPENPSASVAVTSTPGTGLPARSRRNPWMVPVGSSSAACAAPASARGSTEHAETGDDESDDARDRPVDHSQDSLAWCG